MSYGNVGPTTVSYTMAASIYEYVARMIDLGAVEGSLGEQQLPHHVWQVVEALHIVLAGGSVKIKVENRGNPDIVSDLNRRVTEGTSHANAINGAAGYYVTAVP